MTQTINLTQGKVAIVDDDVAEMLNKHKWQFNHGYAQRLSRENHQAKTVMMHREIMQAPPGYKVDHINMDGLYNCRENLRICSSAENSRNVGLRSTNTSGYKGVSFDKASKRWRSSIRVNGKSVLLGFYSEAKNAALAYDEAAKINYGEFARPNFPDSISDLSSFLTEKKRRESGLRVNNNSGRSGVCWHKASGKWAVAMHIDGKRKYFGVFENFDEAVQVAELAAGIGRDAQGKG